MNVNHTRDFNFSFPAASNATTVDCGSDSVIKWALRIINCIVLLVGLVGNAIVCTAVIRRKRMRTSINLFTFNLAFSDLIIIVIYVPSQIIALENCQRWVLGTFMCHVVYLVLPICVSTSIGSLLTISCDRYRAIVYPMKPKLTMNKVKIIIGLIWFVSALTALPLALVVTTFRPAPHVTYCTEFWRDASWGVLYWVAIFILQYLVPLIIIVSQAAVIAVKLRKSRIPMLSSSSETLYKKTLRTRIKQTRKITKMYIALVLLYAICLLPQHVVATFWYNFGDFMEYSPKTRDLIYQIVNIFPMANSALNAIAYGTLNKEFKGIFKIVLHPKSCVGRSGLGALDKLHFEHSDTAHVMTSHRRDKHQRTLLTAEENGN